MSAIAWTKGKGKITLGRRKVSVTALFSEHVPGIALHEGQWLDIEGNKNKRQLDTQSGYKPYVIAQGAACGPVFDDLDKATKYVLSILPLHDWANHGDNVPELAGVKLYRLWYKAKGERVPASVTKRIKELESKAKEGSLA